MIDAELVARLRRGFQKPDGAKRRPSPRELEAADRIEALNAKAEALAEALRKLRDCDWVISLPDRMDAVRDIARAALKAWEATPPASP